MASMDASSTYSAPPPPAIALQPNNVVLSDWDSDSSGGIVVQSKMPASKGVSTGVASAMAPRPFGIFDSDSGDAGIVGILQGTKQEARKWWEHEDEDGDGNGQLEKDEKSSTSAVPFVNGRELNSSARDTTSGGLKNDNEKSVTNRPLVNSNNTRSERSKGVAEVNQMDNLTLAEEAKHRMPNLSRTDDLPRSVQERKPETSPEDRVALTATIGFRSRKDTRQKATTNAELQLANRNLIRQLDKASNVSFGHLHPGHYLRMNPSGTGSSDEDSPTRLKMAAKEISANSKKPQLGVISVESDKDDDTRHVRGSSNNDNHLLHGRPISLRDTVAADFATNHEQKRTYCSSSDDEPPPTDGIVLNFFQVRRKYLVADLPAAVAEGNVSRMRGRWRQVVAESWREFFAAVGLVVSVPLLFVVELFHFVFRDIFYEVVCQLVVIFAAYFMKPFVTVVLFNAIVQPLGALLWNVLHTFRRAVQPLVCLIRDLSLVPANILQSFRLVEVFKQSSSDLQSRRERPRSTSGVMQIV